MNKKRLQSFIQKYYLNGLVESATLSCSDNNIETDFITEGSHKVQWSHY